MIKISFLVTDVHQLQVTSKTSLYSLYLKTHKGEAGEMCLVVRLCTVLARDQSSVSSTMTSGSQVTVILNLRAPVPSPLWSPRATAQSLPTRIYIKNPQKK